jgi:hypothetical protein
MRMRYYVPSFSDDVEDAIYLPGTGHDHGKPTAEHAAKHEWDYRDGWDADWPLTIALVSNDGRETRWSVDMELEPIFSAHKKEKEGEE